MRGMAKRMVTVNWATYRGVITSNPTRVCDKTCNKSNGVTGYKSLQSKVGVELRAVSWIYI